MADFDTRKPIFEEIETARGSSVISFITGDRRGLETKIGPEIIDLFVEHLDEIGPTQKISLILHTNGGDTATAWRLINLLHIYCDELEVIVTSKALSAGTLVSLGANNIVMSKQAVLGPIDPSIDHPLNPLIPNMPQMKAQVSVEAVRGYLDAANEIGVRDGHDLVQLLVDLSNKVHPLVLGQIFRSKSQIRFLAKKLLKRQVREDDKINEIIDFLCAESGSHDYTINRREARDLGLHIENPSLELYTLLRKIHLSYVEELKLLEPYNPMGLLGANPSADYTLKRSAIESVKTGCHQFVSEGTLTKTTMQMPQVMPGLPALPQEAIHDNRKFEGWRKGP